MGFFNNNKQLTEQLASCEAKNQLSQAVLKALYNSMAVIEFSPSGDILFASPKFLQAMDYEANQVVGKHHSMF